jgi:hypothetical protein
MVWYGNLASTKSVEYFFRNLFCHQWSKDTKLCGEILISCIVKLSKNCQSKDKTSSISRQNLYPSNGVKVKDKLQLYKSYGLTFAGKERRNLDFKFLAGTVGGPVH